MQHQQHQPLKQHMQDEPIEVTLTGQTMGSNIYRIKYIVTPVLATQIPMPAAIKSAIEVILGSIIQQMSIFEPTSTISRFNAFAHTHTPFMIEHHFATVITEGIRLHQVTDGNLDITIGSLINLWGFGVGEGSLDAPSQNAIAQATNSAGIDKLFLDTSIANIPFVSKAHPNLCLDVSAIAKGYALDCIAAYLNMVGISNYLIDIGGELKAKGRNILDKPWLVAIAQPVENTEHAQYQSYVELNNNAIATSGDYINYYINHQGQKVGHEISPKKSHPANHNDLASVTVIADNAMTADGLATGLYVAGIDEALHIAEEQKIAVMFILSQGQGTVTSSTFDQYQF